jgi:glycine betaine/choline ABC-type transport system substrate-binding protein
VDEPWQPADAAIAVGSFDFPKSVLLAYIYTRALATKGSPVPVPPHLGARELVHPALMNGLVQLVPGHAGSSLEFVSRGGARKRRSQEGGVGSERASAARHRPGRPAQ